jgi:hypothetical protein
MLDLHIDGCKVLLVLGSRRGDGVVSRTYTALAAEYMLQDSVHSVFIASTSHCSICCSYLKMIQLLINPL